MTIREQANKIAFDVRTHVRDHFTPGSLQSLNDLEALISHQVAVVLAEAHDLGYRAGRRSTAAPVMP